MIGRRRPGMDERTLVTAEEYEAEVVRVKGLVPAFTDQDAQDCVASKYIRAAGTIYTEAEEIAHAEKIRILHLIEALPAAAPEHTEGANPPPKPGTAKRSSYQKTRDEMPPTARLIDDLANRLTGFNPKGKGLFNLGQRDAAKALGCSNAGAWTYIQLHLKAGWWILVERGSKRERKAALYRRALSSELDFEAAIGVYRAYRKQMRGRSKGLRDAGMTLVASAEDAGQDAGTTLVT